MSNAASFAMASGKRIDAAHELAKLRLGMFVHFNPSSVAGREIGWGRNASRCTEGPGNQYKPPAGAPMPMSDEHYDVAYRSFLPEPDWAIKLATDAVAVGAKYVVFTTKHHDGYPNFLTKTIGRSNYPDFADTPMGRSGRDLTREFVEAIRAVNLKVGFYYSQRDWTQPDSVAGDYATYYDYMKEQLQELLTGYGPIDFLWYDSVPYTDLAVMRPPELHTMARQLHPDILINDRGYSNMGFSKTPDWLAGDFVTPEQRVGGFDISQAWESCMTISEPDWSWQPNQALLSRDRILSYLVGTALGDGNLLLNVPPTATGYLEEQVSARLQEVGDWFRTHESAIVETRGGPIPPGPLGGSTFRGETIFIHLLTAETDFPAAIQIPRLLASVVRAEAWDGTPVPFTIDETGATRLDLSQVAPSSPVTILKLQMSQPITHEFVVEEAIRIPE